MRDILLLAIGGILGLFGMYAIPNVGDITDADSSRNIEYEADDTSAYNPTQEMTHVHEGLEITSHHGLPSVRVLVYEDDIGGWNVVVKTQNFKFTPELLGTSHVLGEGHAHLYVDGNKVARLYSEWYHISDLSPGQHTIGVVLSSNDHRELMHDGELIGDNITVGVGR